MEWRIQSLKHQLKATVGKNQGGAKKAKGNSKKSPLCILKKKGTPATPKKTTAPRTPPGAQDVNSNASACAKWKKETKGCKDSFDGKMVMKLTNLRNRYPSNDRGNTV